jgi:protoheme IX farnesyltransferase
MKTDFSKAEKIYPPTSQIMVWFSLFKLPISLMASASAFTGYILHFPSLNSSSIVTSINVFLLAGGSAAMNHYQDRKIDCFFSRTRERPIPRKLVPASQVRLFASVLIFVGLSGLFLNGTSYSSVLSGLIAVLLYNGLYTPLKEKTILAIIPGTICGMMPPLIGWTAAGGNIRVWEIWILMTLIGLWQLPHFWLIILANRTEYHLSNIPNMLNIFTVEKLKKILFIWILAFACTALFLPAFKILRIQWIQWSMLIYFIHLICLFGFSLTPKQKSPNYSGLFIYLNISMGFILLLIIADRFYSV